VELKPVSRLVDKGNRQHKFSNSQMLLLRAVVQLYVQVQFHKTSSAVCNNGNYVCLVKELCAGVPVHSGSLSGEGLFDHLSDHQQLRNNH
jgi:hypothetical protein